MKTREKVENKKGKKLKIVLLVIAAIVIVAIAFINLTTLPKYDDDKKCYLCRFYGEVQNN